MGVLMCTTHLWYDWDHKIRVLNKNSWFTQVNQIYSDLQPRLRIPMPRKLIMPAVQMLQEVLQLVYCLQKWYNDVKGQVKRVESLADGKICQKPSVETHKFTTTIKVKQSTYCNTYPSS